MKVTLVCENCGQPFQVKKSKEKRSHFCCKQCANDGRIKRNFRDLTGKRFGELTVIEIGERVNNAQYWICLCDCGNKHVVNQKHLDDDGVKSCGCRRRKVGKIMAKENGLFNIIEIKPGARFGRWVVIKFDSVIKGGSFYLCRCDCGTERLVMARNLIKGTTKSCGCYHREISAIQAKKNFTTHGHSKEYQYLQWMKKRRYHRDRQWTQEMDTLLLKLQPACVICGSKYRLAVDHVYPSIKGGKLEPGNVVRLCISCNSAKSDKDLDDLPPNWSACIKYAALQFLEAWNSYLTTR